jgi:hypothetical protein
VNNIILPFNFVVRSSTVDFMLINSILVEINVASVASNFFCVAENQFNLDLFYVIKFNV